MLKAFVFYLGGLMLVGAVGAAVGLSGRGLSITDSQDSFTAFDIVYSVVFAAVFLRATWWVYFQDGAELMAEHHRMFRLPHSKALVMLLWTMMMLAIGYGAVDRIFSGREHASFDRGRIQRADRGRR